MHQHRSSSSTVANAEPLLDPLSRPAVAISLAVLTVLLLVGFNRLPAIDTAVSGWFFVARPCDAGEAICGSFPAAADPWLSWIRQKLHYLPAVVATVLAVAAVATWWRPEAPARRFARGAAVAVASVALCSLVLVNLLLKEISGRPRPVDTDLFGGTYPFVEAGRFADYCASNCSFVSGEASGAFWLVGLFALAPKRWRPLVLAATFAAATFTGGLRIAFGGHYLSDVVLAGMLSLTTFSVLAVAAARLGGTGPADERA